MELKLGSVWLLLSCSLQQSLWGILASVPQTNAKKCTHKISDTGEVRKVQMLKRIPARCSGWDEAWSWLSQKDCRTKYKLDYVELPRAVQKVEDKDCEPDDGEAAASESGGYFNVSDEKFLAIAFGSATVALLILILIIVVIRRGQMCASCCSSQSYTTANAAEGDTTEENHHACNAYVEEGLKLMESEYEEIMDPSTREKKLAIQEDEKGNRYQNVPLYPSEELKSMEGNKCSPSNGVVVPSAPYEEDLNQTNTKSVPNEYSAFIGEGNNVGALHNESQDSVSRFTPVGIDLVENNRTQQQCDIVANKTDCSRFPFTEMKSAGSNESPCVQNTSNDAEDLVKDTSKNCDESKEAKNLKDNKNEDKEKAQNEYSKFDDLINSNDDEKESEEAGSLTDYEEPLSAPISSHSYENLDPSTQDSHQNTTVYDSLAQSPVYCEPQTVPNDTESDSPSLPGHVIFNGLHDKDSENVLTGSKLLSMKMNSGSNVMERETVTNVPSDVHIANSTV